MSSSFQALLCLIGERSRDRRPPDTKKFPPLFGNLPAGIVSGRLSALIEAGFELLVCNVTYPLWCPNSEV